MLGLVRTFGTPEWAEALRAHVTSAPTLARRYRQLREIEKIPLKLAEGIEFRLSPGGQNELVRRIIADFAPRFTPGAAAVYVGDTAEKWAYFDAALLASLGVTVEGHGKMPDVVLFHEAKGWLVLVEAVTSHGPVSPKRMAELKVLFEASTAGLVYVTAFLERAGLLKYLSDIAWETEAWVAEDPDHLIHFNGKRFLGPHLDAPDEPPGSAPV